MRTWVLSFLAAGALLTVAIPAAAQTRPHVSGSESSHRTGPTCVVNGDASACDGPGEAGAMTLLPGPVIVGVIPITSSDVSPAVSPALGGASDGRASTDTDVNRSTRHGSALAR